MSEDEYTKKTYRMTTTHGADSLTVHKDHGDWVCIDMETNKEHNGVITIRSQEQAQMLYYMLGQLLEAPG